MRAVVATRPGVLELNFMWLPTFIGMNSAMATELQAHLKEKLVGVELTEQVLDFAHDQVLDFLAQRFPVEGLRDYLDALKFVHGPK
jgi:hypothetical protein